MKFVLFLFLFLGSRQCIQGNLENFFEAVTQLESNLENCETGIIQLVLTDEDDGDDCPNFVALNERLDASNNDVDAAALQVFDEGLLIEAQDILECAQKTREDVVYEIFNDVCNNNCLQIDRSSSSRRNTDEFGCFTVLILDGLSNQLARASNPECLRECPKCPNKFNLLCQ